MQSIVGRARFVSGVLLVLVVADGLQAQPSFSTRGEAVDRDEQRLEDALTQRGSIDFAATPLHEVADILSRQCQAPIVVSVKHLEEAGVGADTPITKRLQGLPLESMLRHILDDLDLAHTVRDGAILITTPEDIESRLDSRIYPVLDLVTLPGTSGKDGSRTIAYADWDSLIEVITTTIHPDSWDEVGGPGSVKEMELAGALVVSQTRDVHREIAHLLASLRRVREYQGMASLPASQAVNRRADRLRVAEEPRRYAPVRTQTWQLPQVYGGN
jgi:hypothetical protein